MSSQILPPRQCLPMKAGCEWSATVHGRRSDLSEAAVSKGAGRTLGLPQAILGLGRGKSDSVLPKLAPIFPTPNQFLLPPSSRQRGFHHPSWSLGLPQPLNSSPLTSPRCSLFCLHSAVMPDGAALSPD